MTDDDEIERVAEAIARDIEARTRDRTPIDTGGLRRKLVTGSLGMPIWLAKLLDDAGCDGPIRMVEVGGRGVLTEVGWVSVEELRELAGTGVDRDD